MGENTINADLALEMAEAADYDKWVVTENPGFKLTHRTKNVRTKMSLSA
jgi:hypothetical protein